MASVAKAVAKALCKEGLLRGVRETEKIMVAKVKAKAKAKENKKADASASASASANVK